MSLKLNNLKRCRRGVFPLGGLLSGGMGGANGTQNPRDGARFPAFAGRSRPSDRAPGRALRGQCLISALTAVLLGAAGQGAAQEQTGTPRTPPPFKDFTHRTVRPPEPGAKKTDHGADHPHGATCGRCTAPGGIRGGRDRRGGAYPGGGAVRLVLAGHVAGDGGQRARAAGTGADRIGHRACGAGRARAAPRPVDGDRPRPRSADPAAFGRHPGVARAGAGGDRGGIIRRCGGRKAAPAPRG